MRASNYAFNSAEKQLFHLILKATKTALIVGTVLLFINQYENIFSSHPINWLKAILSYCVPFCVFLYGKLSQH